MADLPEITVEGSPTPAPKAPVSAIPTEPGRVAFVDPDGNFGSIPQQNAAKAVEAGYRPATDVEAYRAQMGAAGTAAAGVFGAARGMSFGLFDPLAVGASRLVNGDEGAEDTRRSLDLVKRGHEGASLAGEIGGSLLPLALGAGPAGAEGAMAEGSSMLARAGARAVEAAPRLFAEGAIIDVGHQLSEDTLGNHDLVAQKYLSAALEGGIFNVILGAGIHAGVGAFADRLATTGERAAERGAEAVAAETPGYKSFGTRLGEFAEKQAVKGGMPQSTIGASELSKLGRTVEEQQLRVSQIGRTAIEEGITSAGASKAVQAERVTKRVAELGDELGTIRQTLEKSAVRPSAETVVDRIGKEVVTPLLSRPFSDDAQRVVRPIVEEIAARSGAKFTAEGVTFEKPTYDTFKDLYTLRSSLDRKLEQMKAWEKFNGEAPGRVELKQIRGVLEDEFEKAADRASVDLGDDIATKYRVAKGAYSDLKTFERWASKAAGKEAQNRAISLSDTLAAQSGVAAALAGHPLGLLAPLANKVVRTYGNQIASAVADKGSKLLGVQRAAELWDARLEKSVKGFFSGKKTGSASGASPDINPQTMRQLRAATKDPAALTERVSAAVAASGLTVTAPKIAQAMTNTMMRAGMWLGQNIPPEPPPAGFTFGPSKPRALGPYAQAKVNAAVGALNMDSMLADLERGRVDRQKIAALAIINPEAHAEIIAALRRHGEANQAELTHQQEVALSILTGQPIGVLMQPKTIRGFQAAHAQSAMKDPAEAGNKQQPIGSASGGGKSRNADAYRAGTDKLEGI